MAREGEYDPVSWRHRMTKEEAALPPRTQGQKLVPTGVCVCGDGRMQRHVSTLTHVACLA